MKIYPKIDEKMNGIENMKEYIERRGGIEIQMFHNDGIWGNFNIIKTIDNIMNIIPKIREITIHPPLKVYDIEFLLLKDNTIIDKEFKEAITVSKKYNINVNMLYHQRLATDYLKEGIYKKIIDKLKIIENTNVKMILENTYYGEETEALCSVLSTVKQINNEHLKACIDICHLHCLANIYKLDFKKLLKTYLNKDVCEKHVYQIHFAATLNNDGYNDIKTHGRKHETLESLVEDYNVLADYNMINKNIITEVSEDMYKTRKDQIEEIEMLKMIGK